MTGVQERKAMIMNNRADNVLEKGSSSQQYTHQIEKLSTAYALTWASVYIVLLSLGGLDLTQVVLLVVPQ